MSDCPTPWKKRFPSPQAAFTAGQVAGGQEHYHCPNGHWHLATPNGKRTHNLAASGKAQHRTRWQRSKARRKMFGKKDLRPPP